jgi:hypothetical protein
MMGILLGDEKEEGWRGGGGRESERTCPLTPRGWPPFARASSFARAPQEQSMVMVSLVMVNLRRAGAKGFCETPVVAPNCL